MSQPARNAARIADPKPLLLGTSTVENPAKNTMSAAARAFRVPAGRRGNACLEITAATFFDDPATSHNTVRRQRGPLPDVPVTPRQVFDRAAATL
jgi:hypothetical protein